MVRLENSRYFNKITLSQLGETDLARDTTSRYYKSIHVIYTVGTTVTKQPDLDMVKHLPIELVAVQVL